MDSAALAETRYCSDGRIDVVLMVARFVVQSCMGRQDEMTMAYPCHGSRQNPGPSSHLKRFKVEMDHQMLRLGWTYS